MINQADWSQIEKGVTGKYLEEKIIQELFSLLG